jgi:DNA-binding CsgD family transcriptional regulator
VTARTRIDAADALWRSLDLPIGHLRAMSSAVLIRAGDLDGARAELDQAMPNLFVQADFGAVQAMVIAVVRAELALATGDLRSARSLIEACDFESSNYMIPAALVMSAHVARHDGELLRAESTLYDALAEAAPRYRYVLPLVVEMFAGLRAEAGAWREVARLLGSAESYRRETGLREVDPFSTVDDDLRRAREALGDAGFEAAYDEGLATPIDDAVVWLQRGRGARRRRSSGWDSLTPTEVEVVRLVAEGLANKQIAARLFMSPRTVSTNITHVFTKLAITSRTELAAEATRRAL